MWWSHQTIDDAYRAEIKRRSFLDALEKSAGAWDAPRRARSTWNGSGPATGGASCGASASPTRTTRPTRRKGRAGLVGPYRHPPGDPRPASLVADHVRAGDEIWGVVVTRTEVLAGMRAAERRLTLRLLAQPLWLEVDADLADAAGRLARKHRRSHAGIGLADFLITAGVERLEARLLTRNVRHFPMIPDLEPAY